MSGEVSEVTTDRSPLLPDRHPQRDLFVCDIVDAVPKGDMSSMEHPVFSLSTKPDMRPRRYERGGSWIEVSPSRYGTVTVHDRDVLIYCISQCMATLNDASLVIPPSDYVRRVYLKMGLDEPRSRVVRLGQPHFDQI